MNVVWEPSWRSLNLTAEVKVLSHHHPIGYPNVHTRCFQEPPLAEEEEEEEYHLYIVWLYYIYLPFEFHFSCNYVDRTWVVEKPRRTRQRVRL